MIIDSNSDSQIQNEIDQSKRKGNLILFYFFQIL